MDCLKNYIGIRQRCSGVEYIPPRSGLYIEQLEGIHLKSLSGIEPGKYLSAVNMINDKINFTGKKFVDIVRDIIYPDLVDSMVTESGSGGVFNTGADTSNNDYHEAENVNKGLRLKKARTPLTSLRIVNVILKANSESIISGQQFTLKDGINEYTYDIPDLEPGEEFVMNIDYLAKQEKVDIYWNTNDFEPAKGTTSSTQRFSGCSGCSNNTYDFFSAVGLDNGTETRSMYGIKVDFIIECNMEKALCLLLSRLNMPFLYAVGIELLNEWIASDSLSLYTIYGKEWAQNKIVEWSDKMQVGIELIKPSMTKYLKNLDSNCFTCKSFRYGNVHP